MNVNMIHGLVRQHKALKAFHSRCNQNGITLTATGLCPDGEAELVGDYTALIIVDVRGALLKRITETEEAIIREAH